MEADNCWVEEAGEITQEAFDALTQHISQDGVTVFKGTEEGNIPYKSFLLDKE